MEQRTKPGWKSTEFWLSAMASVVGAIMATGAVEGESALGKVVGVAAIALVSMGYSISRGAAKRGA